MRGYFASRSLYFACRLTARRKAGTVSERNTRTLRLPMSRRQNVQAGITLQCRRSLAVLFHEMYHDLSQDGRPRGRRDSRWSLILLQSLDDIPDRQTRWGNARPSASANEIIMTLSMWEHRRRWLPVSRTLPEFAVLFYFDSYAFIARCARWRQFARLASPRRFIKRI